MLFPFAVISLSLIALVQKPKALRKMGWARGRDTSNTSSGINHSCPTIESAGNNIHNCVQGLKTLVLHMYTVLLQDEENSIQLRAASQAD